jgi:hypothetical protein
MTKMINYLIGLEIMSIVNVSNINQASKPTT